MAQSISAASTRQSAAPVATTPCPVNDQSTVDCSRSDREGTQGSAAKMGRKLDARAPTFSPSSGLRQQEPSVRLRGSRAGAASQARQDAFLSGSSGDRGHANFKGRTRNGSNGRIHSNSKSKAWRSGRQSEGAASARETRRQQRPSEGSTIGDEWPEEKGNELKDASKARSKRGQQEAGQQGQEGQHDRETAEEEHQQRSNQRAASGKNRRKSGRGAGGNANHLLNFQFQPISEYHGSDHEAEGGRSRKVKGATAGKKGSKVWGGGSTRGPMSKEQFLQANFHFLLHNWTATNADRAVSASSPPQEAFFDPDVLVDWDTVDTVRLFRKVASTPSADVHSAPVRRAPVVPGAAGDGDNNRRDEEEADGAIVASPSGLNDGDASGASAGTHESPTAKDTGHSVATSEAEASWGSAKRTPAQVKGLPPKDVTPSTPCASGDARGGREGDGNDEWSCPICLGQPTVPRLTKCGHGPFCLVCILRHLNGEVSARCPLCFDKMHRDQLRRAVCDKVVQHNPGGRASLVLLCRERASLVPRPSLRPEATNGDVGPGRDGGKGGVPGNRDVLEAGEDWCPREGNDSERFSRLVTAKSSTLCALAAGEHLALQSFRQEAIASDETEWVPFISQAQALVEAQLRHFSALVPEKAAPVGKHGPHPGSASSGDGSEVRLGAVSSPTSLDHGGSDEPSLRAGGLRLKLSSALAQDGTPGDDAMVRGTDDVPEKEGKAKTKENGRGGGGKRSAGGGAFRFFQSLDGQKAFLHPLDMRQLLDDADKGLPLPDRIDSQVLEVETVKLTPELRRRLPFLGHLPIHCDISFLEVDMSGLVSAETTMKFREETQKRDRRRRTKAAEEARALAKEVLEEEQRAARIAAMRAFTVDLQGPKPGDADETPPTTSSQELSTDGAGVASPGDSDEAAQAVDAATGASQSHGARAGILPPLGDPPSTQEALTSSRIAPTDGGKVSSGPGGGGESGWSFARVTAMNGHFPSLAPTGSSATTNANNSSLAAGSWGGAALESRRSESQGVVEGSNGAWGTAAATASRSDPPIASSDAGVSGVSEEERSGAVVNSAGKKKGRKGKAVALFSNAGVRGGR